MSAIPRFLSSFIIRGQSFAPSVCSIQISVVSLETVGKVKPPRTNGSNVRFNRTVLDELFRLKMRENSYESVEVPQDDLDEWLAHYNTEQPHPGYQNQGRRPIETINLFVRQED
jgi:hypothetical protein